MLNIVFSTTAGAKVSESPLSIQNDEPGLLTSDLYLPTGRTIALRFSGRGQPTLEGSEALGNWSPFEVQPSKSEILVPDTTRSTMEFFTFTVE